MQRESDTLVGLSVGTSKISVIVAEKTSSDSFRVLCVGNAQSHGLSKGVILNLREATQSVRSAVRDASNMLGKKIESAVVAFNSLDVSSELTEGHVTLDGAPRCVEDDDLNRVIQYAQSRLVLPQDMKPIHTIPVSYGLDKQYKDDPLNMVGTDLEMWLHTVSIPQTYRRNLIRCVEDAGIRVDGLVLKPLAASLGSVLDEEMQAGCIGMSIGGGVTGLVLYKLGRPFKIISIPIGGELITSDLATVLKISKNDAEELKKRLFREKEDVLIRDGVQTDLALDTIIARLEELFIDYVGKEIADCKPDMFPGGIILSGGVSMTPGIAGMLSDILNMRVRVANIRDISKMPNRDDPSYASALGVLKYYMLRNKYTHLFIDNDFDDVSQEDDIEMPDERDAVRYPRVRSSGSAAAVPQQVSPNRGRSATFSIADEDRDDDDDLEKNKEDLKTMLGNLVRNLKDLF